MSTKGAMLKAAALIGLAQMFDNYTDSSGRPAIPPLNQEDYLGVVTENSKKAKIARYIKGGLKEFTFGDKTIWALNQRNADRKFNNLKT